MLRSLLYEVRIWPAVWRHRLSLYWQVGEKGHLAFIAMLAVPFVVLGLIIQFAYTDQLRKDAARQRARDLRCLAENIYFEARSESLKGQYAVAEVTMNRLASPLFPDTLCDVVYDTRWDRLRRRLTAHFSWTQLKITAEPKGAAWNQAMQVAATVYDKKHTPVVPDALFYHATYVNPYWASSKRKIVKIGNHIFYR